MSQIVKSPAAEPAPPLAPQGDSGRYLLRPAALADLPALERLAEASAIGIRSLVPDRALLRPPGRPRACAEGRALSR